MSENGSGSGSENVSAGRATVAVVGGGYGGAAVAKALDGGTDVVLIEPKDAFVHSAGALRALVRPDWAANMFFPYDRLLSRGRVLRERASSVDPGGVTLASGGRIDADYLVLATGSDYAFPAKTETDSSAEALRRLRVAYDELTGAERVLILGAGPVGLELAGEIRAVWPAKRIVIVDPAPEVLPGFLPEVRADLLRQLAALDIELRLGVRLDEQPPGEPGRAKTFTVPTTPVGDLTAGLTADLTADIWFRCHGVRVNGGYLGDGRLTLPTPKGQVRVTDTLNVTGPAGPYAHVYALGDLTDVAEAKMAGHAMRHADVVARNILAQARGERATATYLPSPVPSALLPLGPGGGVGQLPDTEGGAGGAVPVPAPRVAAYKGADLFVGRFAELFGTA
ncbi:NADH dehydrogenase, FAD-containing subunit [Actinacidiphila alni]|uniref:NADH dehydrogenase, FAD-containing subunit n=1 Tax=Actinacidiphila alni TaxID=380248 RepID=A0A1I2KRB4_9ACTN|nr:FAD-dependent oxidoreductase [Actinacidiphila alni]SFF68898.1 NADH dehydrogenase, FAD-containing subunit [Actinacidiphila alni]